MSLLPPGWIISPIEDVMEAIIDYRGKTPTKTDSGIPLITARIIKGGRIAEPTEFISYETYSTWMRRGFPKKGDVLITTEAPLGEVAQLENEKVALAQRVILLRGIPKKLDNFYLKHVLQSKSVQDQLRARSTGTTVLGIKQSELRQVLLPLPPIEEQRRIAAILDKADAVRRKRKEAIALTEELLRSAFLNLVGTEHSAYHEWPEVSLGKLALPKKGSMRTGPFGSTLLHSEFVDQGIAVLGIDNAVQNRFAWGERRFITPEKYEGLQQYTVKPGDVIITIMGTIGRSAVVPEDIPTAINTKHLAAITLDRSKALPEYLSNAIHRDPFVLHQIALRNRGAIMAGLNLGIIKELKVRLPPLEQQVLYDKVVKQTRQEQKKLEKAANTANELFNSLLQRAFRGEL